MERLNKEDGVIMNFYKITNKEERHNGLQYKTGLNVDPLPWNPSGDCAPGGIYFSREDIFAFVNYGPWIRKVTIPEDAEMYENPGSPKKWKANKVILGKRRKIGVKVIKSLIGEGADIHIDDELTLKWASENGHFETAKLLLKHGANVNANNEWALRCASINGHLKIVKLLIKNGSDIHDWALRFASENGHLEIVKILIEHGAYTHAKNNGALMAARIYGHTKVAEFLLKHGATK